jgi:hypothetical protein
LTSRVVLGGTGYDADGELSPDEARVADVDWDGANSADLSVKSLGTGAVKQITSFTPAKPKDYAFAEEPRWSPDSTKLGMTLVGASNGEIAVLENFLHQERPVSPANAKGMVAPTSAGAGRAFALRQVSLAKFPGTWGAIGSRDETRWRRRRSVALRRRCLISGRRATFHRRRTSTARWRR